MWSLAGAYGFGADSEGIVQRMAAAASEGGATTASPAQHASAHVGSAVISHCPEARTESAPAPVLSTDQRSGIVYQGLVYNAPQLGDDLASAGRTVAPGNEAEMVLQAHAQWGSDAYDRLNGMFAFAIAEADSDSLILVRDHFGVKPLYYWSDESGTRLLFASSIPALLASGQFEVAPDDRSIYRYLRFRVHDDTERTFFAGIKRVPAGGVITISPAGIRIGSYTTLREDLAALAKKPGKPYSEAVAQEYRERFIRAIGTRIDADEPVGTSLSGGLDSSSVAAVIAGYLRDQPGNAELEAVGEKQNTFSAVFPNSRNDEEKYVDAVLHKYPDQIEAHKIQPNADQFLLDLEDFVRTQAEPIISTGPYAQYVTMREASQVVSILLDGQGADEMMAGYNPYFYVYLNQLRRQRRFPELATELAGSRDIVRKLAKTKYSGRTEVPIEALLNNDFVEAHRSEKHAPVADHLKTRLLQDTFEFSLPALLRYEHNNATKFGLEGRLTFVDKELLRYVFTLEDAAILHRGWNKRILRDAMTGILPEAIRTRRNKIGFTTPESEWFRKIGPELKKIFTSKSFASRPYFDAPSVIALFEDYLENPDNHGTLTFWRLLNIELWMRAFIDPYAKDASELESAQPDAAPAAIAAADVSTGPDAAAVEPTPLGSPNPGKNLDLVSSVDQHTWRRFPLRTELVSSSTDLTALVTAQIEQFFADPALATQASARPWYYVISEKIVAITQGRSYYTWQVSPRPSARVLSKFVARTPAGIGLGDPTTMELAIREVGLPRIAAAAAGSVAGKLVGRKGVFYQIAGSDVRAIDGPTPYSAFPSNVSAKLPPKDPDHVSSELSRAIRQANIPVAARRTFVGTVVMDANDIGRNVLGKDVPLSHERLEATFADNPLGQGRQRTPMAIMIDQGVARSQSEQ